MKTDWRDYSLTGISILLILAVTVGILIVLQWLLVPVLSPLYAPIALAVLFLLLYGLVSALFLRLLQRFYPLLPGHYRLNHPQFRLWKLRHVISELAKGALAPFFPVFMRQALYALLGARIGKNVAVAGFLLDPELTTLEDGCIIGEGAILSGHTLARGRFVLAEVRVGAGATVGGGAGMLPGARVGAGAIVLPGGLIESDVEVGDGEVWGGLPATRIRASKKSRARLARDSTAEADPD